MYTNIWCKFVGYKDWCNKYRIPEIEEFVEGFQYEHANYIRLLTPEGDCRIDACWGSCIVGDRHHNNIVQHIKCYLEEGFIRVLSDESINNKKKTKVMKVYYFQVIKKELEIVESKIKGFGKTTINQKYKYIIEHGSTQKEAYDSIINTFKIKDSGFGECQNILNLEVKSCTISPLIKSI